MYRLIRFFVFAFFFTAIAHAQGNALVFNGTSNYVSVPNFSWPAGGPVTIEFWNRVNAGEIQASLAFRIGDSSTSNIVSASVPWSDRVIYWDYGANSGNGRLTAGYNSQVNRWVHIALVSEGNSGNFRGIYIDGFLAASSASSDGPDIPLTGLHIGGLPSVAYHKGRIDEFRVWNVARTQQQIQSTYQTTLTGTEAGLVGYWKFDEGSGNTSADASGHGNTATLINSPTWSSSAAPLRITQTGNIAFNNSTGTQAGVSWTSGNGNYRAVFVRSGTTGSVAPVNGTTYSANATFGSGSQVGTSGWYCVYNGAGSSVTITGLTSGAEYRVAVCEYFGSAGYEYYMNAAAAGNPANAPIYYSSAPAVSTISPNLNENNVITNPAISATFDQIMNTGTLNAQTILVYGSVSGKHTGTIAFSNADKTFTFSPGIPFKYGEIVNVTLTNAIQNINGTVLPAGYHLQFTVKAKLAPASFTRVSQAGTHVYPSGIVAADFNGDGNTDIATPNQPSLDVSILLNNGSGVLTETSRPVPGNQPGKMISGDFDGNGTIDLALTLLGGQAGTGQIGILSNNGSGIFSLLSTLLFGLGSSELAAGDFDGDGDLDIAVTYYAINGVYILINNGAGTFSLVSTVLANYSSDRAIVAGDFNLDGTIDLALGDYDYYSVTVLSNNGYAGFTRIDPSSAGTYPTVLSMADFNGDRLPDLAIARDNNQSISILSNAGNFSFQNGSPISASNQPRSLSFADFDGDGALDLIGGDNSNSYNLFKNNGLGTFALFSSGQLGSQSPGWVTSADFNNDGAMDFALASSFTDSVHIMVNTFTQAGNITFTNTQAAQTTINWSNGNGSRRAVFASRSTSGSPVPVNNTTYTANTVYGSGMQIGSTDWYCVYNGTGTSVTVTGLAIEDSSRFAVCEYLGANGTETYFTTLGTNNPKNLKTVTTQAGNITFANTGAAQTDITWINGNGSWRAVFVSHSTVGSPVPVNNITYTANTMFGSGTQIGLSGWYCVYNGTGITVSVTGLAIGDSSRVAVCDYMGTDGAETYFTTTGTNNPKNVGTITTQAGNIAFANTGAAKTDIT
ncbi:MAG: VCBS repeat-containing protein [Ignavibacteriales bacterium]|nr:VCBS repeat-containing protein [Ignavibacteriales bacterium]